MTTEEVTGEELADDSAQNAATETSAAFEAPDGDSALDDEVVQLDDDQADEESGESENEGEEDELYEIEVDEDDIYAYIVDEDDNEIGFILLDENGEEQEYYYADDEPDEEAPAQPKSAKSRRAADDEEYDLGITREGVAEATADMNAIYKDGVQIAAELKSTFDDISEGLSFLKKK